MTIRGDILKQEEARVVSVTQISGGVERPGGRSIESTCLVILECPEIAGEAKPGQFVMVTCGDATLPRPFSINRTTAGGNLCLYFAVLENGAGTSWLSHRYSNAFRPECPPE